MRALQLMIAAAFVVPTTLAAQTLPFDAEPQAEAHSQGEALRDVARTADTGAGEIGQRQTRSKAAPNIEPLGRINNRIEARVQNRLRNRLDRNYDPTANATAPFERAEDRLRKSSRRNPR